MIWFSGNSELQVPQDSDKKSCSSMQKFACVHEYFPVYTSVHFPDHEMEQLCLCTVTRKFYLKSVLFSSQCVYPIPNFNIYFLLMFRSSVKYLVSKMYVSNSCLVPVSSVHCQFFMLSGGWNSGNRCENGHLGTRTGNGHKYS